MNNDLISRSELKKVLCEFMKNNIGIYSNEMFHLVDSIPAVEQPQGEWGKWIITEIQCPNCFEYFETDCYSTEELNKCPSCRANMRKPNCVTCDHFGKCEGCEKRDEE